jgi:hypothetical protein
MMQFLDLPEEILLELIIRFLSIFECINLVSVGGYSIVAAFPQRLAPIQYTFWMSQGHLIMTEHVPVALEPHKFGHT